MRRLAHGLVAVLVAAALLPTAPSAVAAARPMPVGVTAVRAVPAGPDQVRVTWRGGARTTRYAFIAGSTSMTDVNHFQSRWIPASDRRIRARSVVLTVPVALRPVLGAGSGNYVFVKVVQTNATGSPPVCRLWTPASSCRASASGTSALAGSTLGTGPSFPLRAATWNVQSVSATQDADPAHRWASRLPKVVRAISAAAPDVIGTQESTTARLDPACLNRQGAATASPCREQYMDLGAGLAPEYALAAPDAWLQPYRQQQRHAGDGRYSGYVDSAILYRTAAVELLDHGFVSPLDDLGLADFRTNDESGVWALLRDRASGQRFLMVSMHFPVGDGAAALRRKEAVALAAWLVRASAARGGVPVLVAADLNSYAGVDAQPAVAPLRTAGFTDAAAAPTRTNPTWASTNHSNTVGANSGYPVVAVPHPYPTNRIDYLLVRVAGAAPTTTYSDRYDNVVHLTPDRRDFDAEYQGSDHTMQVADLRLPIS